MAMQSQWRVGASGATGLDYAVLPFVMKTAGVKKKNRADVFMAIQVMEDEALKVMHEK